jgi:hypothetical protein
MFTNSKSDKFDWTRKSGRTPSYGTGPGKASSGSYYLFIEASWPRRNGDTAVLTTGNVAVQGPGAFLSFDYHMWGSSIGSLQVKANSAVVKTLSGNKGNKWLSEKIDLSRFASQTVTLSFVGTRGRSWSGDIAIDDVKIFEGVVPTTPAPTTPAPTTQPPAATPAPTTQPLAATPAPTAQPPVPPGAPKKIDEITKKIDELTKLLMKLLSGTTTGPPPPLN